jgi:hypothetical protein
MSPDAVAAQQGKTLATIYAHMERLLAEGKPVDVDRYVEPATRMLAQVLLNKHGTERLAPVVEDSHGRVTYDDARLVRAWMTRGEGAPHHPAGSSQGWRSRG